MLKLINKLIKKKYKNKKYKLMNLHNKIKKFQLICMINDHIYFNFIIYLYQISYYKNIE